MGEIITSTGSPATRDLVQLSTVKTELGIADSSEDAKLQRLIGVAAAAFSSAEGLVREPWLQSWSLQMPGRGGTFLLLRRWPVVRVISITEGVDQATTVTASEYSVAGPERDRIYRENGWIESHFRRGTFSAASSETLDYTVACVAGWLLPGVLSAWTAETAYVVGEWAKAVSGYLRGDLVFEATTAGTSDATEPTWPTTEGGTVTDGTVVWTARAARELPEDLEEAALLQVIDWYRGALQIPAGVVSERFEGLAITYAQDFAGRSLSPWAAAICRRYR